MNSQAGSSVRMISEESAIRRFALLVTREGWGHHRYISETPDTFWEDLLDDDERAKFRALWASAADAGAGNGDEPDAREANCLTNTAGTPDA